jgi:hypothetical protein
MEKEGGAFFGGVQGVELTKVLQKILVCTFPCLCLGYKPKTKVMTTNGVEVDPNVLCFSPLPNHIPYYTKKM